MTDRIKGFVVTLEKDIRDDDVQVISDAISMIKGVISVENSVCDPDDTMNRQRIQFEIREKFMKFAQEILK